MSDWYPILSTCGYLCSEKGYHTCKRYFCHWTMNSKAMGVSLPLHKLPPNSGASCPTRTTEAHCHHHHQRMDKMGLPLQAMSSKCGGHCSSHSGIQLSCQDTTS